jgi:hypothetical protein
VVYAWQARRVPTSAKDKTGDSDAVDATPDDTKTFGDEVREHFCPGKHLRGGSLYNAGSALALLARQRSRHGEADVRPRLHEILPAIGGAHA